MCYPIRNSLNLALQTMQILLFRLHQTWSNSSILSRRKHTFAYSKRILKQIDIIGLVLLEDDMPTSRGFFWVRFCRLSLRSASRKLSFALSWDISRLPQDRLHINRDLLERNSVGLTSELKPKFLCPKGQRDRFMLPGENGRYSLAHRSSLVTSPR